VVSIRDTFAGPPCGTVQAMSICMFWDAADTHQHFTHHTTTQAAHGSRSVRCSQAGLRRAVMEEKKISGISQGERNRHTMPRHSVRSQPALTGSCSSMCPVGSCCTDANDACPHFCKKLLPG
jgi:hypothetical protein